MVFAFGYSIGAILCAIGVIVLLKAIKDFKTNKAAKMEYGNAIIWAFMGFVCILGTSYS